MSNWCQKEATYEARYNASFPVMGGGTITFTIHDSNCRTLANCGPVENSGDLRHGRGARDRHVRRHAGADDFTQPRTVSLGGTTY